MSVSRSLASRLWRWRRTRARRTSAAPRCGSCLWSGSRTSRRCARRMKPRAGKRCCRVATPPAPSNEDTPMTRTPLALLGVLAFAAAAPAQSRDTVYYRDRTAKPEKTAEFVGTVSEETVNGIKVKPQVGPDRSFPVGDIVDVVYAPPRAMEIPFQPILNGESALRTGSADKAKMAQLFKD